MLRRIFVIAATAAMLALSALPAYASAHTHAHTHKLSFPAAKGISDWGTYVKTSKYVRISVCVKDTSKTDFAVGAVAVGTNANGRRQGNLGAVAIGPGQTVCRSGRISYTSHLKTYVFVANRHGYLSYRSRYRKIY
jgi:hypothetical protein